SGADEARPARHRLRRPLPHETTVVGVDLRARSAPAERVVVRSAIYDAGRALLLVFLVACSDDTSSSGPAGGGSSSASSSGSSASSSGSGGGDASTTSSGGTSTSSSGGPSTGANGTCKIQGQAHKTGLTTSLVHSSGL